jgi:hypothetical protein
MTEPSQPYEDITVDELSAPTFCSLQIDIFVYVQKGAMSKLNVKKIIKKIFIAYPLASPD